MQLGIIVGLLFGVLIALFAFVNRATVVVNYFFGQVEASVALIILASAMSGALAVGLFGLITQIRTGFTIWNYKKKTKSFAKEVEGLKTQKQALLDDLAALHAESELLLQQEKQSLEQQQNNVETAAEIAAVEAAEETSNDSE